MKNQTYATVIAVVSLFFTMQALASTNTPVSSPMSSSMNSSAATVGSNRIQNKLGAGFSIGEPAPTILGINAGYNVTDFLRAQLGYGSFEVTTGVSVSESGMQTTSTKATTLGGGVKGFVPGWSLSPTAGLHYSHTTVSGDGEFEINGIKASGGMVYGSLGVDWQAKNGFNAAMGYNLPFSGAATGSVFASAGWFFDVVN